MTDEEVDILDESGFPTGVAENRNDAHIKELYHEVVHVWILDKNCNLLIQWRSPQKKQYSNVWHMSVAGHVSSGSSALDTAVREVAEEIGVKKIPPDRFVFLSRSKVEQKIPETGKLDREWVNDYLIKIEDSEIKFRLQDDEVKEIKWISLGDFETEIKTENDNIKYLNHPKTYYLDIITLIKSHLENNN